MAYKQMRARYKIIKDNRLRGSGIPSCNILSVRTNGVIWKKKLIF